MRGDRTARMLSLIALSVALLALVAAGRALMVQREHSQQVEALGDLIRQSAGSGRPIMDMGPPRGGRPGFDRGE